MPTSQTGAAGANSVIINGSSNQISIGDIPSVEPSGEEGSTASSNTGHGLGLAGILAVLFIGGCLVFNSCDGPSDATRKGGPIFPEKSGTYPAEISDSMVLSQAAAAIQSCAQAVVLKPANCPQSVKRSDARDATNVHWALYGNPVEGAIVRYSAGQFHVLGSAIMMASYTSASEGKAIALQIVRYWAQVEWSGEQAKMVGIRSYDGTPKLQIRKSDPHISSSEAVGLVKQAFEKCIAGKKRPMAAVCPKGGGAVTSKANWMLNGDPSFNTSLSFDPKTGLTHVTGSYSATARYQVWLAGEQEETQSGDYDALFAINDGKPLLLQIVHT